MLTERERACLALAAQGLNRLEIGREQHLTENTVKTHMKRIFAKLKARNITHAVVIAHEQNLIHLDCSAHPDSPDTQSDPAESAPIG